MPSSTAEAAQHNAQVVIAQRKCSPPLPTLLTFHSLLSRGSREVVTDVTNQGYIHARWFGWSTQSIPNFQNFTSTVVRHVDLVIHCHPAGTGHNAAT
jgi:hypothetical protein